MHDVFPKITGWMLTMVLILNCWAVPSAGADRLPWMPSPGQRVGVSQVFKPTLLKGLMIHPSDAFRLDFLVAPGDQAASGVLARDEYPKLVKYFLAALTVPDEDQWVNLSPYEKDRIIEKNFSHTVMGRDLLAQDYILKQMASSLLYPEDPLGKTFWTEVFSRAAREIGTTDIPVNTIHKVWIIPDHATVYEKDNAVYVLENHLKVLMEQDYLAQIKVLGPATPTTFLTSGASGHSSSANSKKTNGQLKTQGDAIGRDVMKKVIIPVLEKEINEGKNFALLRQIYSAMVLAAWYKRSLKQSLLSKVYVNRGKLLGLKTKANKDNNIIYQNYVKAFKQGVFNYIKEDADFLSRRTLPRKFFSGGLTGTLGYQGDTIRSLKRPDDAMTAQLITEAVRKLDVIGVQLQQAQQLPFFQGFPYTDRGVSDEVREQLEAIFARQIISENLVFFVKEKELKAVDPTISMMDVFAFIQRNLPKSFSNQTHYEVKADFDTAHPESICISIVAKAPNAAMTVQQLQSLIRWLRSDHGIIHAQVKKSFKLASQTDEQSRVQVSVKVDGRDGQKATITISFDHLPRGNGALTSGLSVKLMNRQGEPVAEVGIDEKIWVFSDVERDDYYLEVFTISDEGDELHPPVKGEAPRKLMTKATSADMEAHRQQLVASPDTSLVIRLQALMDAYREDQDQTVKERLTAGDIYWARIIIQEYGMAAEDTSGRKLFNPKLRDTAISILMAYTYRKLTRFNVKQHDQIISRLEEYESILDKPASRKLSKAEDFLRSQKSLIQSLLALRRSGKGFLLSRPLSQAQGIIDQYTQLQRRDSHIVEFEDFLNTTNEQLKVSKTTYEEAVTDLMKEIDILDYAVRRDKDGQMEDKKYVGSLVKKAVSFIKTSPDPVKYITAWVTHLRAEAVANDGASSSLYEIDTLTLRILTTLLNESWPVGQQAREVAEQIAPLVTDALLENQGLSVPWLDDKSFILQKVQEAPLLYPYLIEQLKDRTLGQMILGEEIWETGGYTVIFSRLASRIAAQTSTRIPYGGAKKDIDKALLAKGGIDFNAQHMDLKVKGDGQGVSVPLARYNEAMLAAADGLIPLIISIKPAIDVPIVNDLKNKFFQQPAK